MNNSILIDEFVKCRLESVFGDGTYWGCLTISGLVIVIGIVQLVLLILLLIMRLNIQQMKGGNEQWKK